jgi:PTH1 family peptidyl-tRNA hydrolase
VILEEKMKVIVGLGNPGKNYEGSRHNTGFNVVDRLAEEENIDFSKKKFKGLIGEGRIGNEKVILLKPQTYMNLSGESVRELCDFYHLTAEDIIVVYDDISLPPGGLRIREKGSAGGHNGIKNIILHMNTDKFVRVKVGVGDKPKGWDLADYVLSCFAEDIQPIMNESVKKAAEAVKIIISDGVREAMNKCNFIPKPENNEEN